MNFKVSASLRSGQDKRPPDVLPPVIRTIAVGQAARRGACMHFGRKTEKHSIYECFQSFSFLKTQHNFYLFGTEFSVDIYNMQVKLKICKLSPIWRKFSGHITSVTRNSLIHTHSRIRLFFNP